MKSRLLLYFTALSCASSVLSLGGAVAQQKSESQHHHYKLVVLSTLGGPNSFLGGEIGTLNNPGIAVVQADTPVPDPSNPGGYIDHVYAWKNGIQTDFQTLPTLPNSAGNNAYPNWINEWGLTAGWSANGVLGPFSGLPEAHAVIWTPGGKIFDLGTMGGYQSHANAVNDFGQVVGSVENTTPDPFSFGDGGETQAFIWQFGAMRGLGTLGGLDSNALFINDLGQAAGCSWTSSTPNETTGIPTLDAFIWENGKMVDLNPGNFGGTGACANFLNNHGQVVGFMSDADENNHPFLWDHGKTTDLFTLGTLGGKIGSAHVINDLGHIAGDEFNALNDRHAVLWRDGGIIDLQTVNGGPCSDAYFMNSSDQVVGTSGPCDESTGHAFLWENGAIVDLNALISSSSGIQLQFAFTINESGEIAGEGTLTDSGDLRGFLLIPCDSNHPGLEGCDYSLLESTTAVEVHAAQNARLPLPSTTASETKLSPVEMMALIRSMTVNHRRRFGVFHEQ
jgi:probable HAF family extracellular repeat protein